MRIRDNVYLYMTVTIFCLVSLAGLVGFDHLSYDKAHFALQIEQNIHDLEIAALHATKEGDWINQVRSVQSSGRIFSNFTSGTWQAPFAAFVPPSTAAISYKTFPERKPSNSLM